jgi:hypothetical protein
MLFLVNVRAINGNNAVDLEEKKYGLNLIENFRNIVGPTLKAVDVISSAFPIKENIYKFYLSEEEALDTKLFNNNDTIDIIVAENFLNKYFDETMDIKNLRMKYEFNKERFIRDWKKEKYSILFTGRGDLISESNPKIKTMSEDIITNKSGKK